MSTRRDRKPKITEPRQRFFYEHAGWSVPPGKAACARALARAEKYAERHGWRYEWCDDPDFEAYCACDDPACTAKTGPAYGCVLTIDGEQHASLWGITFAKGKDFANDPYGRVIQAELASEALHDIERRAQEDRDAERYMAL